MKVSQEEVRKDVELENHLNINSNINLLILYRDDILSGRYDDIPIRVLSKLQEMGVIIRKYGTSKSRALSKRGIIYLFSEELKNGGIGSLSQDIVKKLEKLEIIKNGDITEKGVRILNDLYNNL